MEPHLQGPGRGAPGCPAAPPGGAGWGPSDRALSTVLALAGRPGGGRLAGPGSETSLSPQTQGLCSPALAAPVGLSTDPHLCRGPTHLREHRGREPRDGPLSPGSGPGTHRARAAGTCAQHGCCMCVDSVCSHMREQGGGGVKVGKPGSTLESWRAGPTPGVDRTLQSPRALWTGSTAEAVAGSVHASPTVHCEGAGWQARFC